MLATSPPRAPMSGGSNVMAGQPGVCHAASQSPQGYERVENIRFEYRNGIGRRVLVMIIVYTARVDGGQL